MFSHWWHWHWERTGIIEIELADTMPKGWQLWRNWHKAVAPNNEVEIKAIEADAGRTLGYVCLVGRRRPEAPLEDPIVSIPAQYIKRHYFERRGLSLKRSRKAIARNAAFRLSHR